MTYYNYEENQNLAFALLVSSAVQHLKSNGATDQEVRALVDDSILGIINMIQDDRKFSNHVYNIIAETCKKKIICNERQAGMMCELLDRIEDSIRDSVYNLLEDNDIVITGAVKSTQADVVLNILTQMQRDGKLDFNIDELDH